VTDSKIAPQEVNGAAPSLEERPSFFGQRAADDPRTKHAFNLGRQSIGPMHADGGWRDHRWYDAPREDAS